MSTFIQTYAQGPRTIYTVLNESKRRHHAKLDCSPSHPSPTPGTPSESSFSCGSGSSYAPSDHASPRSSSPDTCPHVLPSVQVHDADFDATDATQLSRFVPSSLRQGIQAAKYSNLVHEEFDTGICWEALPPQFAIPTPNQNFPMLSELSISQSIIIHPFLYKCRDSTVTWEEIFYIAEKAGVYVIY